MCDSKASTLSPYLAGIAPQLRAPNPMTITPSSAGFLERPFQFLDRSVFSYLGFEQHVLRESHGLVVFGVLHNFLGGGSKQSSHAVMLLLGRLDDDDGAKSSVKPRSLQLPQHCF